MIYVFLYGQPAQDLDSYEKILQRIEVNKIQINVVQSSLNPCGQDISLDGLISLTQFSGGSFITATTPNAGNVFNQVPTNYMSNLIYENIAQDCTDTTFYVPIDVGTQSFTTYVQGFLNTDVQYTSPTGMFRILMLESISYMPDYFDERSTIDLDTCSVGHGVRPAQASFG